MTSFQADATISRASPGDLAQLTALFDAYRCFFAGKGSLAESERFLCERLTRGDSVIFVGRTANRIAGFIQLYPLWSSWHCRRIWFVSDLWVTQADRNRGFGRRLVERAIEHAHQTGASSIMVELPLREPHLKEFYEKLGFHRDAVFDLARYTVVAEDRPSR